MDEFINEIDASVLVIIGGLLPLLQALINRRAWTTEAKSLASFAVACGVGIGAALMQGVTSREGIVATVAAVYGLSQLGYFAIWRPTGVANSLEEKTG